MNSQRHLTLGTLRHNISIESDIALARREFAALTGATTIASLTSDSTDWQAALVMLPMAVRSRVQLTSRQTGVIAFMARLSADAAARLVRRAAFIQDVAVMHRHEAPTSEPLFDHHVNCSIAPTVTALTEYASWFAEGGQPAVAARLDEMLAYLTTGSLGRYADDVRSAVLAKKTTLSLTHDLHIYKAKFFPRMVKALLNVFIASEPAGWVVDPFSGSGTALLEGALLGLRSAGLDVDPVSALISQCKVSPFTRDRQRTREILHKALAASDPGSLPLLQKRSKVAAPRLKVKGELGMKLRRRDERDGTRFLDEIELDLGALKQLHRKFRHEAPGLIDVLVSDAITKKIRYRFVGVGNGRYTIEVVRQRILERFYQKVASCIALCDIFEWLENRCHVRFGETVAMRGSALDLAALPDSIRIAGCVTSPPYLPASSGREHYADARQLALTVTGLTNQWAADEFIGTRSNGPLDLSSLTPTARRLLDYLASDSDRTDPQRDPMRHERKALPTVQYLHDVEQFLRALATRSDAGVPCIMVIAAQHVFYSHRAKQEAKRQGHEDTGIEHVVRGRDLYGEIAERSGWSVEDEITLELAKSATSHARPRATDEYHEAALILRRVE